LNLNLLCPDTKSKYIKCPTLIEAESIIKNLTYDSPKTFIIHNGTNDLETTPSNDEMINRIQEVIKCINKKYPLSRVIVSSLLPRKDDLNRRASEINKTIQKIFEKNKTVKIVQHNNIMSTKHLKDKKHLNEIGVKLFALNLKRAYFNKPSQTTYRYHSPETRSSNYRYSQIPTKNQYIPNNRPTRHNPDQDHISQQHPRPKSPTTYPYNPYHHHQFPMRDSPSLWTAEKQIRRCDSPETKQIPMEIVQLIKHLNRYVN
jgi:hypothetical protein